MIRYRGGVWTGSESGNVGTQSVMHWQLKNCPHTKHWKPTFCRFQCMIDVFFHHSRYFSFRVFSAGRFRRTSTLPTRANTKAAASSTRSRATSASCAASRSASPWAWPWTVSRNTCRGGGHCVRRETRRHSRQQTLNSWRHVFQSKTVWFVTPPHFKRTGVDWLARYFWNLCFKSEISFWFVRCAR